jgi:hypothetical protein
MCSYSGVVRSRGKCVVLQRGLHPNTNGNSTTVMSAILRRFRTYILMFNSCYASVGSCSWSALQVSALASHALLQHVPNDAAVKRGQVRLSSAGGAGDVARCRAEQQMQTCSLLWMDGSRKGLSAVCSLLLGLCCRWLQDASVQSHSLPLPQSTVQCAPAHCRPPAVWFIRHMPTCTPCIMHMRAHGRARMMHVYIIYMFMSIYD